MIPWISIRISQPVSQQPRSLGAFWGFLVMVVTRLLHDLIDDCGYRNILLSVLPFVNLLSLKKLPLLQPCSPEAIDGLPWPHHAKSQPIHSLDGEKPVAPPRLFAVDITMDPTLSCGAPRMLFEGPYDRFIPIRGYDVTSDGRRFLMSTPVVLPMQPVTQINVVLNWFEELKRRVPVD